MQTPIRGIMLITIMLVGLAHGNDLRGHSWGDPIAEVQATETMDFEVEVGHMLYYKGSVANLPTTLVYQFTEGRLTRANYVFKATHYIPATYIDDFDRVQEILVRNYGEPNAQGVRYHLPAQDVFPELSYAIIRGELELYSEWHTDRTSITHVLSGEDFRALHGVIYASNLQLPPTAQNVESPGARQAREADEDSAF